MKNLVESFIIIILIAGSFYVSSMATSNYQKSKELISACNEKISEYQTLIKFNESMVNAPK